ncbi:MAG: DUF4397 domain-containing protein [Cyanobacteria bacterium J06639_1]
MVSARMAANLGALLGVAALSASLSSCSESVPPASAALNNGIIPGDAQLRFVNVSPNAPELDLVVEGEVRFEEVAFGFVTDYTSVPAGSYDISLAETDAREGDEDALLANDFTEFPGDRAYTVVALDEASRVSTLVLEDSQPASLDEALVRFVHAIPDAPSLTLSAIGDRRDVIATATEFGSVSEYVAVEPDISEVEIFSSSGGDVQETLNVSLEVGRIYTVYALGLTRGTPNVDVAILEDASDFSPL